ncbi:substrate-binding periplasmic protein [Roseateles violae]|uniref:Transporter substrate-binding domain-containing protein n=1 Tax=Roseateles violae TaxID=3058042 RepID=A0ABT8DS54_9BURK|nr:transporter substrate-binding domain-containing protein [Pelomonas sp. PFR6]MDN3920871.1 transporter substrate-binding domain-containing protein [Pelomonas sp. PFR6]
MKWRSRPIPAAELLAAATALVLPLLTCPAAACEKTVRWNEDPPFSMRGSADGELIGLNVELVRETLRRLGCSARWVEMPWARALAELEAGRLDILPGTLRLPERERFAYFSAPGPQSRNRLFVRADELRKWASLSRLADLRGSGFRLGAQLGVAYGPDYDELMRDPEFARSVHRTPSRRSLWLMVDAGRLDGVLVNEMTGRRELAQLGLQERIKDTGLVANHPTAAVAFSRKTIAPDFVARYNKAAEAMQQDGSQAAIVQRYAPGL